MKLFDDDPAIIARMLAFIYTGEYCIESLTTTPSGLQLEQFHNVQDSFAVTDNEQCNLCLLHCAIFALADKYHIPTLRAAAYTQFTQRYYGTAETDRNGKNDGGIVLV